MRDASEDAWKDRASTSVIQRGVGDTGNQTVRYDIASLCTAETAEEDLFDA